MSKLENASGNFLEIVNCVQNGEAVQWQSKLDGKWEDTDYEIDKPALILKELINNLDLKWRKKPDAFEKAWDHCKSRDFHNFHDDKEMARHFWIVAIKHITQKADEVMGE